VIEGVDWVKGKRTLVRTILYHNQGLNPQSATVKVFLQNQGLVAVNLSYPLQNGTNNVDLWFFPQMIKNSLTFK
jgi:hypothetical protein